MTRLHCHSFFITMAETPEENLHAEYFKRLLSQQAHVLTRMNNEIAVHRQQSVAFCEAMEARNKELADQDEIIDSLRNRARKEARHKCYWAAAAVLTWVSAGVWLWLR